MPRASSYTSRIKLSFTAYLIFEVFFYVTSLLPNFSYKIQLHSTSFKVFPMPQVSSHTSCIISISLKSSLLCVEPAPFRALNLSYIKQLLVAFIEMKL